MDNLDGECAEERGPAEEEMPLHSIAQERASTMSPLRVSFSTKRGKKAGKFWRGRLKSRATQCGPSLFSALSLCDKFKIPPRQDVRRSTQNRVAWVDLDGRLVNAGEATALAHVGGNLGAEETLVWEGLRPLQRVLVVAIAAASAASAASASKGGTVKEVLRLRQIIAEQEEALVAMREKLSNFFTHWQDEQNQSDAKAVEENLSVESVDDLVYFLSQIDMCESGEPDSKRLDAPYPDIPGSPKSFSDIFSPRATTLDSETALPCATNWELGFTNMARISPIQEEFTIANGDAEQELMEKTLLRNNLAEDLDIDVLLGEQEFQVPEPSAAEAVNKGVVFEENVREQGKEIERSHEDLRSAGETCGRGYLQENATSVEWLSETSSVLMNPLSPVSSEKVGRALKAQESEEYSKDWLQRTLAEEKSVASRARCGNMVLDVKKQVIVMLDQTASDVLEVLASISDKIQLLELPDPNAVTPKKPDDAWNKKYRAFAAIQDKVSTASRKVSSFQNAMSRLLDTRLPEVMASLDISPSDFDDYLANLQIAKILNDDASHSSSTGSLGIETWQDWFRQGFDNTDSSFLNRIESSDVPLADRHLEFQGSESTTPGATLSEWPPSASGHALGRLRPDQLSPGTAAFREKVEKMMVPLNDASQDNPIDKSAQVAAISEGLISEFEKCAAKVASLKTYVRGCDKKRKQVERKLLEAWEQDSKNQAKVGNELTELKRQVRLKDSAYQQLISSRKALVSSKAKEITELKEDCKRQNAALQDMASAAKATQDASDKRLAMLEEICKKKDATFGSLKQEIFELEGRIQELQACQTPAQLRPMNVPPTERENDAGSVGERDENQTYRLVGDDCQLRSSYQSFCGSETRRTSWGSDLSGQEFHIIDTPWSQELSVGQSFNIIEEAAFQGQSLNIFHNVVTPSPEFFRSTMRKLGSTTEDASDETSSCSTTGDPDTRPTVNIHQVARSECRKELSKSVTNMGRITGRSKERDDKLRASTGVLAAVGPNTLFKPTRSSSFNKERSQSSLSGGSNAHKPKENARNTNTSKSRQKWV